MVSFPYSFPAINAANSTRCDQKLGSHSRPFYWVRFPNPFLRKDCLTNSSVLIIIGVVPARNHNISLDEVRNTFALFMYISLCNLIYLKLLYSNFRASAHTGEPERSRFKAEHLYTSCRPFWSGPMSVN